MYTPTKGPDCVGIFTSRVRIGPRLTNSETDTQTHVPTNRYKTRWIDIRKSVRLYLQLQPVNSQGEVVNTVDLDLIQVSTS